MRWLRYLPIVLVWLQCTPIPAMPSCNLDGVVDEGEECDDGNPDPADACTNLCRLARCGDDVLRIDLDPGAADYEACEPTLDSDCSLRCSYDRCGDGVKDSQEECDDANTNDADACRSTCEKAACGDGITRTDLQPGEDGYESCDDQNDNQEDGCTTACGSHRCGDSILRLDRQPGSQALCAETVDCEGQEVCRDGRCLDPLYEACDDGNAEPTDGCSSDCLSARCGDGVLRADVEIGSETVCRPGGDDCPDNERCVLGRCAHVAYEFCDDGEASNADECVEGCVLNRCGDGFLREGLNPGDEGYEACDDGNTDDGDYCSADCQQVTSQCGDGVVVYPAERCDDGNTLDLDDCSADCLEDLLPVEIPQGCFARGLDGSADYGPAHQTCITGFMLDRKEVTVGRYRQFLEFHPDHSRPEGWIEALEEGQRFQGDELKPITHVTRDDALAYCGWLDKTLPTEAQWEFAARGPDAHPYPWGASPTPSCGYAVRQLVNSDRDPDLCARGGEWKPPCSASDGNNAQGVCDLIGNVREWTLDGYRYQVYESQVAEGLPLNDPFIPFEEGMASTLRGDFGPAYIRANGRRASSSIGFRCAQPMP